MTERQRAEASAGLEAIEEARELLWLAQAAANDPTVDGLSQIAMDALCAVAARIVAIIPPRYVEDEA